MADDNDPPKNPFIRWKQHVDAHIGMTLHGLLGIPNMVSKNLNIRQEPSNDSNNSNNSNTNNSNNGSGNGSGSASSGGAQPPPPAPNPPASSSSPSSAPSQANSTSDSRNYSSSLPAPVGPSDNNDDALDGVDAAQLLEWHKFIYYSPYSPLKLQQQKHLHLLPPPVPQDVPFGADPFAFTYADAFEDLLRASSDRPLLDLGDRSYRNLRYQMRYGSSIEPPYAFFHRMHSQRLLDVYFPRSSVAVGSAEENNGTATTPSDTVVRAVTALAEQGRDLWREHMGEEVAEHNRNNDDDTGKWDDAADDEDDDNENPWQQDKPVSRIYGYGGSLFGELDRVFRVLGRIIEEDTGASEDGSNPETTSSSPDKKEADAEDELYHAVRSAYSNAERSLSTLIKSFSGGFDSSDHYTHSSSSSTSSTSTTTMTESGRDTDGRPGETIQTTEEHVDAFGNRHVKIVVQRLDADGNEVSRETRYTIRSQSAQEAAALKEPKDVYEDSDDSESSDEKGVAAAPRPSNSNDTSKNSGWFWK
ncbi:hypothetical protein SEUCBS139899_006284 [Sporothrix eucalyptigena]